MSGGSAAPGIRALVGDHNMGTAHDSSDTDHATPGGSAPGGHDRRGRGLASDRASACQLHADRVLPGFHCPICSRYLAELPANLDAFAELGVEVIAVSCDDAERARQAKAQWKLERLTIGHGLDLDTARRWGLYVSTSRGTTSAGVEEPRLFAEPGVFLVRPDGTLYLASIQTMPFARPQIADILQAVGFVLDRGYPARGEA